MNAPATTPPENPASSSVLPATPQTTYGNPCPFSATSIEVKVTQAEKPGGEPKKKDILAVVQGVASILSPLIIFFFGYVLTTRVDTAIKAQQLHSENVKQMQQLLTDLVDPNVSREKAHASAVVLAAYGGEGVPMLLHILMEDTPYAGEAAATGLLVVARQDVPAACAGLGDILSRRAQLYSFSGHRRVLTSMRNLGCADQLPVLQEYKKRLDAGAPFPFRSISGQDSTVENAKDVEQELASTLQALQPTAK